MKKIDELPQFVNIMDWGNFMKKKQKETSEDGTSMPKHAMK